MRASNRLLVRGNSQLQPLHPNGLGAVLVKDKIAFLRGIGLKLREIAAVEGASESTVSRWASGTEQEPEADGVDSLYVIARALLEGVDGQERFAIGWLRSRNRALRNEQGPVRPLDALARGRYEDVDEAVRLLRSGVVASPPQARSPIPTNETDPVEQPASQGR